MPRPNRPPPGFFNESSHPWRRTDDDADAGAPSSGGCAGGAPVGFEPGAGRGIPPRPNLKPQKPPMRRSKRPPPGSSDESRQPRRRTAAGAGSPPSGGGAGGAARCRDLSRAFGRCRALLDRLLRDDDGWVFEAPVDARALGLRDYYTVVANPMDLGTVLRRLERRRYADPREFAADVRLTFRNAMSYNNKGDPVYESAAELSGIFEDGWTSIEAELPPPPPTDAERKASIKDDLTGLPVTAQRTAAGVLKERGACLQERMGKVRVDLGKADASTLDELDRLVADTDVNAPSPRCRKHESCETEEQRPKRRHLVLPQ
ncbi:unnamed protein product [Urochloa decumbens]|uniref:Bromo domain-containing protein n=1 Tax=Urochloa decumbens TaxID=240449 RepID=A0ABC8ZJ63_9POAL